MLATSNGSRRVRPLQSLAGARGPLLVWRRRAATAVAGLLALLMAYGVTFGHNGLTAYAAKRGQSRMLLLQSEQLERENNRLQGHVDRLQSDPSAIEHQAREELHYTRSDEVIYTLPASDSSVSAPTTAR